MTIGIDHTIQRAAKRGVRRRIALALTLSLAAAVVVSPPIAGTVSATGPTVTASLPTDNPANFTPNVLNGQVDSIWQVGNTVIIGGTFSLIADSTENGGTVYSRTRIAAFDATTGRISTSFNPGLSGAVEVVIPAADGTSIYIGGDFNTVNGVNRRKVAQINVADGSLVTAFDINGVDGLVRDLRLVDGTLYVAGLFTNLGGQAQSYLGSVDATTGAVTSKLNPSLSGLHNGGVGKVIKIDVTPDGSRLLLTGNFTTIDGQPRRQVALFDLTTTPASLSPWNTTFFNSTCSNSFDSFMRDLDISEDGTFATFTTTGAYRANTSCDTVSRFELTTEQEGLNPTWVNMTGGDTSYAAEIHDGVVYVGGHMRWFNNPFAADRHGAGGVYRSGMGALDAVTGLPFSWNPTRTRGVGLFDYFVTEQGIWAGSDTDRFNNELRSRLAFFPFAGGSAVVANSIGELPNDVVLLGNATGTVGTVDPSVMYRINAGGPALPSVDDGPNWLADTAATSPFRTSGSNAATAPSSLATPFNDAAVLRGDLDRAPAQVWTTERNDPSGGNPMNWSFPVPAGTPIQVRLYLANRNAATDNLGNRVFDVALDGVTVLDDLDLSGQVGHNFGTMRSFSVISDGSVDINFVNGVNNPLINGIEIIQTNIPAGGTFGTQDAVTIRQFDGAAVNGSTPVDGTVPWRTVRGAFMVNDALYTLHLDGTLMQRTFDGTSFGPGNAVDMWANNIMADAPTMTGMFYEASTSRVYYTLSGQSSLFYRTFLPESGVFHAQRSVATGAIASLSPARVRGMFLGNGQLWFGDSATGNLLAMPFVAGEPSGTPTIANATTDWRSRALFRSSGAQPNVPPVAAFTSTCEQNVCTFDASGSTDSDGTITGYTWEFGDGSTSTGAITQHSYAAAGTYTVTVTATDDRNGTGTFSSDVVVSDPPNVAPTAVATATCSLLSCTFTGSASSDSDGAIVSYGWAFGDGAVGSGDVATHDFVEAGQYTAVLTVTDDDGTTSTAQVLVEAIAPSAAVLLRASAAANSQSATPTITVPAEVQAGDQLVYIVTSNTSTSTTTPPGWTLIGTAQDGSPDMTSWVFARTADASSAGSVITLTLGTSSKTARTLLAYDNAVAPTTALSSVITGTSASLTTAPATIVYVGSTVVSYWSDKSGGNTAWTVPPTINVRAVSVGSGSGRITAAVGDRIEPAGTWPGATATSTMTGTKGIGWTVLLQPATGNLSPTASFSASCSSLQCSFNAMASTDPDGTIVDYQWDFGDGTSGTGVAPVHTFPGDGTFNVTLTVMDNQSATATSTTSVPISLAIVTFRAENSSNANSSTASVTVPATVQVGDQLLLLITANAATTTSTPSGWTLLGSGQAGAPDMVSIAFTRTADAAAAGSTVQASLGVQSKVSTTLVAYSGAGPITTAAVNVAAVSSATHTTPAVTVTRSGSQVLSYWVDKTSGNTGWTTPGNVAARSASIGSGAGRVTAFAGDTVVAAGPWTGATATSSVAGTKTIGWSIVVPAP